jgi:FkbM family methyltransferase
MLFERLKEFRRSCLRAMYGRSGIPRTVNGIALKIHPDYRWYFSESYDSEAAAYFRSRVSPGAVCLSVGANLGMYPLQMVHWSGPNGKVFAFEPNPNTAKALRRNIEMNRASAQVEVVEQAVSSASGTTQFAAVGLDGMSRIGAPNPLIEDTVHEEVELIDVPLTTLDDFCRIRKIQPSVLMMDIEGFEIAALKGAAELLTSGKEVVAVIELHPNAWESTGYTLNDLRKLIDDCRLKAVPLTNQRDALTEYGHIALERIR